MYAPINIREWLETGLQEDHLEECIVRPLLSTPSPLARMVEIPTTGVKMYPTDHNLSNTLQKLKNISELILLKPFICDNSLKKYCVLV